MCFCGLIVGEGLVLPCGLYGRKAYMCPKRPLSCGKGCGEMECVCLLEQRPAPKTGMKTRIIRGSVVIIESRAAERGARAD